MSTRKLRPRAGKKDYRKMADGETSEKETGSSPTQNQNNNKHKLSTSVDDDGSIFGEEVFVHTEDEFGDSSLAESDNSDSEQSDMDVTDAEIASVQSRIEEMKLEEKRIRKLEKFKKLSQEAEQMERSLKKLKKKSGGAGKQSKKVTNVSLRGMKDVMEEVDKLMDKKVKRKSKLEISSEEEENEYSDEAQGKNVYSIKESKPAILKSGKNIKVTSYVKKQEDWPHTFLAAHFVTKEKGYEELTLAEFCAGYAAILEDCDESILAHRISHFKELMYLATKFQWRHVLNYHAAALYEIECGRCSWGDNFQMLQNTTLAGGLLSTQQPRGNGGTGSFNRRQPNPDSAAGSKPVVGGVVFCPAYQTGTCLHNGDHQGEFRNQIRQLKHICGNCWIKNRKMAAHSELSEVCPYFGQES